MHKPIYKLHFPKNTIEVPATWYLVKDYDIKINILKAKVDSEEDGMLVIQMDGTAENIKNGVEYLKEFGIQCEPLQKVVKWHEDKCTHCTACTSQCPTDALTVDRTTMKLNFNPDECIVCGICCNVCSYKALTMDV